MIFRILPFIMICFIVSCSMFETAKLQLVNALPRETDVPGWLLKQQKVTTDREKIEKKDRIYYLFGVQEYARAVFYSLSNENVEIVVELISIIIP